MIFSNLLKQTTDIEIGGVKITIKKFSFGFTSWLALKQFEGRDLRVDDKDKKTLTVKNAGVIGDYQFAAKEKILNAVQKWDLLTEDGTAVEITPEVVQDLIDTQGDFCGLLLLAIDDFCILSQDKKKSLDNS